MAILAHLTDGDGVALAGVVGVIGSICLAWIAACNSRKAEKQTRPNGGASMRDVVDRIESKVDTTQAQVATVAATQLMQAGQLANHTSQMTELVEQVKTVAAHQKNDHKRLSALEQPTPEDNQ